MGCNMCVVQKPEDQYRVMLQVSGKEGARRGPEAARGGPRGPKEPLVLQVLRRSPRGRPPLPHDYFDGAELGDGAEPERPEELEYEEVELYKASHRDKLGLTVCYRTDGEEDAGIYVGEVNPNSIAAKDGRIREGDRIIQINGVEVQDREEAVAFLTREQQTNISLLLARPESQRWKDSDREDFLDDFGSDEDGELRQRGPWTPPGQPPSPVTPCARGPEPDSGVGRTDESTRNEESSEHDLLAEEAGEAPPPPRRPPRAPERPAARARLGTAARPGAGAGAGAGSGARAAGRAGAAAAGMGAGPGGRPGAGSAAGAGLGGRPGAGAAAGAGAGMGAGVRGSGPAPAGRASGSSEAPEPAGLSQAELRRYRQLRGRLGAGGGAGAGAGGGLPVSRAEVALLEEELRHLEFKCRHLLRAQKMQRLRERCLRAWLEASAGAGDPGLADISEVPERDSTSAYNTGESCRSSPLLLRGPAAGGKAARAKRPGRDRLLKARAIKILEERGGGSTTDDDARSELKTGRYWSREQRKQHLARAREQRRRRELLLQSRMEAAGGAGGAGAAAGGAAAAEGGGQRRGLRKRSRRILDNWVTIQEMLARGTRAADGGRVYNPLLSVTTV
ncbi:PDZ domain-containing protein 4-like [Dromaius novaehollandiae]|uniref:PDZ domain-containing protein 4-like n=1 Tax=Dromaius novaehollandiae TaxID=8790 RepID=UPI00311FD90F